MKSLGSKTRFSVLRRRSDFLSLMKNGYRVRPCDWLLMNYAVNHDGLMRCGWTLPRYVGSAVVRNRLKRWSRVYFRHLTEAERTLPVDVNLVFRKAESDFYKKLDYEKFQQVLDRAWNQIEKRTRERLENASSSRPRSLPNPRN